MGGFHWVGFFNQGGSVPVAFSIAFLCFRLSSLSFISSIVKAYAVQGGDDDGAEITSTSAATAEKEK